MSRTGCPIPLLFFPTEQNGPRKTDPRVRQRFIGMIRPIRMDHAIFYKRLIKIIIRAFTYFPHFSLRNIFPLDPEPCRS